MIIYGVFDPNYKMLGGVNGNLLEHLDRILEVVKEILNSQK